MNNEIVIFENMTIKVAEVKDRNNLLFIASARRSSDDGYISSYVGLSQSMAIDGLFRELAEIAKEI